MRLPDNYENIVVTIFLKGNMTNVKDEYFRPTYEYARPWVVSVLHHKMKGVIIHDGCIEDERLLNSGIHIINVGDTRTSNNPFVERWFLYEKLLTQNPQVATAFFTDAKDIFFHRDVHYFFYSELKKGSIIVQEEWLDFVRNAEYMKRLDRCNLRPDILDLNIPVYKEPVYAPLCAGFFGGSREVILTMIGAVNERYIAECDMQEWDMVIFNYVLFSVMESTPKMCVKSGDRANMQTVSWYKKIQRGYNIQVLVDENGNYVSPMKHGFEDATRLVCELTGRTSDLTHDDFVKKFSGVFKNRNEGVRAIIKELNMMKAVELGVEAGFFSEQMVSGTYLQKLYSIDTWRQLPDGKEYGNGCPSTNTDESAAETMMKAAIKLAPYKSRVVLIRELGKDAVELFPDRSLDAVYIDADHSYKSAKQDIYCWIKKVRVGGIIMGHDYMNYYANETTFEVKRAVDEIFGEEVLITEERSPSWAHVVTGKEVIVFTEQERLNHG